MRAPGKPIICAIESARGVLAAVEIAATPGVRFLAMGGVDLQLDLNTTGGNLQTLYARSHLVLASRAAGIEPPIDSVYPRLDDPDGKPEGLAFTAEGLAIVALDTQKARHNLVLSNLRSRPRRAQR